LGEFKSYPIGIVGNTSECKTILISSTNFYFRRSLVYNFDTEIKLSDTISSKFAADIHWGGFAFIKKNVSKGRKKVYNGADILFYLPVINMGLS
jgi:hypothetical protein